jgi:hypothetical protein
MPLVDTSSLFGVKGKADLSTTTLEPEITPIEVTKYGLIRLAFTHQMAVPNNLEPPGSDIFSLQLVTPDEDIDT